MAYILQDNKQKVLEIYVSDGIQKGTKYVLMIMEDGTVSLTFYSGEIRFEQENPCLSKCFNGMKVEYGKPNGLGVRASLEFLDYCNGKLAERWEKIK